MRPQHGIVWDHDVDRAEAPGVHRDVVVDHDAEHVKHGGAGHRLGRVEIRALLRRGAGEIDRRLALLLVDGDPDLDDVALVGLVAELAVVQLFDDAADAFVGVVLHVLHVGVNDVQSEQPDHLVQFLHALFVGGDLRLEVVDVLQRIACRIFGFGEQIVEGDFAELAAIDQLEVVDIDAFLFDRGGDGRH